MTDNPNAVHGNGGARAPGRRRRRKFSSDKLSAILTLVPSLILLGVFVYGFIFWSGWVSLSKWNSFIENLSWNGLRNYGTIFASFRFQSDLRNLVFFTVAFVGICLVLGVSLAALLDQKVRGESIFRSIYMYPMAISAAATGVVWDWLLNPSTGINLILRVFGVHHLPRWYLSAHFWPSSFHVASIQGGVPIALLSVVIAMTWEWCGFAVAVYLAGLRAVPNELREAARVDGASAVRTFFSIVLPQLRGSTTTAVTLLVAVSLKAFALLYAMTGAGPNFVTDLPPLNMFSTTFSGNDYGQGAAIAIVLLLLVLSFIVPYLLRTLRQEARS